MMPSCIHWWHIETPNGTSWVWGCCKRCGEVRSWPASQSTALSLGDSNKLATVMREGARNG